jgi:hypothetical protein
VLADEAQADQTAPVLPHEGDVLQPELVEQRRPHPLHVGGVRVVVLRRRLVGTPEADEVGGDAAQPGGGQDRDHLPVEEAPRRLTVQQEHDGAAGGALVEVVDAQRPAVTARHLHVPGGEREVGQALEAVLRRTQHVHGSSSDRRERSGRAYVTRCSREPGGRFGRLPGA